MAAPNSTSTNLVKDATDLTALTGTVTSSNPYGFSSAAEMEALQTQVNLLITLLQGQQLAE